MKLGTVTKYLIFIEVLISALLSCDLNTCLNCDMAANYCHQCDLGYFSESGTCKKCSAQNDNCIRCDSATNCLSCNYDYMINKINNSTSTCLYCSDAISNNFCKSDCTNESCLPCRDYSLNSSTGLSTYSCKAYGSSFPSFWIYIIVGAAVIMIYLLFPRKKLPFFNRNKVIAIHPQKCSMCSADYVINCDEYFTNCKGYLCEPCYLLTKDSCKTGIFNKCLFCDSLIICFVDYEGKKEKEFNAKVKCESPDQQDKAEKATRLSEFDSNHILQVQPKLCDKRENNSESNALKIKNEESSTIRELIIVGKPEEAKQVSGDDDQSKLESCVICLGTNLDCVIPCKSKPLHKVHKYCLVELLKKKFTKCPICKSDIVYIYWSLCRS